MVILGGGAAGFSAAIVANDLKVKTAMINSGLPLGGTCVNVGCVPSKHILEVAKLYRYSSENSFQGLKFKDTEMDFRKIIEQKNEIVNVLRTEKYASVLDSLEHVDLIEGQGRFTSEKSISVNNESINAQKFIITTGSSASIPPVPGILSASYLTNIEALELEEVPEQLLILGGGPLALEFAYMFNAFGSKVTILQRSDRILSKEEPDVSTDIQKHLENYGIEIETGLKFENVSEKGGGIEVAVTKNDEQEIFSGTHLLLAAGVRANTRELGLDEIGLSMDGNGSIEVNKFFKTNIDNIFAAGDVIGYPQLETTAAKEGNFAAQNLLNGTKKSINYDHIPRAVFTDPQVASVGITEDELMKRIKICGCRTIPMTMIPKARAILDTRGIIKMVVDPNNNEIVGVHIVSPLASEIIHEATLIVQHKMTLDDVINTVHVFPTLSEAIKIAAISFRQDITKLSCCSE